MNFKTIGIIVILILVLAVGVGVVWKMTQETEGQQAENITNYNFEPHQAFFGCARYIAPAQQQPAEIKK